MQFTSTQFSLQVCRYECGTEERAVDFLLRDLGLNPMVKKEKDEPKLFGMRIKNLTSNAASIIQVNLTATTSAE